MNVSRPSTGRTQDGGPRQGGDSPGGDPPLIDDGTRSRAAVPDGSAHSAHLAQIPARTPPPTYPLPSPQRLSHFSFSPPKHLQTPSYNSPDG